MIRKIEINGKKYTYEQVRHIGEHVVHLPKVPKGAITIPSSMDGVQNHVVPLNELIINLDEPIKEERFWKRQVLPKYFYHYIPGKTELWAEETAYTNGYLSHLSEEDTSELIYCFDREVHRRKRGVFMIQGEGKEDGVIEWLTEDNYFFLQWNMVYGIKDENLPSWREPGYLYGEFRKFQRDVFQLIWKVKNDPNILGLFIAKPKKTGITQILASYYLNKATLTRMQQMGIMSKGQDAAAVNMLFFFHAFNALPQIFKPTTRDLAPVEGSIFFSEPGVKSIMTKRGMERFIELQSANPLNTKVWAAPTKAAGFDSPVMSDIWLDEFPKYDTENKQQPKIVWERNQETVKLQDFYNGLVWITSYPPEEDTEGFFQAREIYFDSKLSKASLVTGRTPTGLITLYISALNSYYGCFDKFGNCNEVLAAQKNKEERDKVRHDPAQLQSKMRQYSETEQECWAIGGVGSIFNPIRLSELRNTLDDEMRVRRFFDSGKLLWEKEEWEVSTYDVRPNKEWCRVRFEAVDNEDVMVGGEEGRLRIYQAIPSSLQNSVLYNGVDDYGNLIPNEIISFVGGTDPTDLAEAGELQGTGSKNSSFTMNLPDISANRRAGKIVSKVIVLEYFYRPDNPWEFYEDLVKEIIWTGKRVIVEANKKWVATQLIKDGLGRFMIVKQKSTGKYTMWTPELEFAKDYTLLSTEGEELNTIIRAISRYIQKPKPHEAGRVPDYGSTIKSERLLDQLAKVTKKNHKKFDAFMSIGWTLIGMEILLAPDEITGMSELFREDVVNAIWDQLVGAE